MAVLKDTLIQGSARVTDTLYTTNIAGGKIIQPITWTADGLPEKGSSAEFFLAIDSFQNGGKTYWVSKANTLSAIGAATSGHNHDTTYLKLSGGKMTGRIYREGASTNWNKGRDNALVATSSINGYSPVVSIKTTNGSWDIGAYNNADFTDDLLFSYIKDTTYNGTTAKTDAQIRFYESGGALFVGQTTITYNPGATDSTAKGMINLTSSAPATVAKSGSYSWGINHLVPNLASGGHTCLITGMGNGSNNSAALEFNYVGSNHADNSVGLGLYGNNQLLTINKAGTTKIKATTASTSSTTGALVVGGGIATGAASYLTGSVHIIGSAGSNALIVRGISGCDANGNRGDPATASDNAALYLNLNNGPIFLGGVSATATDAIYMQYTQDASSSTTGAVRIGGGLGVAKKIYAGSIISAPNFTATHAAGGGSEFKVQYSSTISYWWGVGTGNENHGLYDDKANKWIILAGAANTWSFDGNAATATKATQDGSGNTITNKYFQIYNTSYQGNSSAVTVNDLATQGPAYGMINHATDNPIGSATWVHVLNLGWSKANTSWIGQIALHTNGTTMYFRGNSSSAIAGKAWNTVLSSNNYSSYALPLSGGTMSGTITLANTGLKTPNEAGFTTDQYGNLKHQRATTGDTWQWLNNAGTAKLMYTWENGDINTSGSITATGGFLGNATNVTGTVTYQHGGTGLTTLGSAGQVLKVNSSANGIEWGTVSTADEKVKVAANITTAADYPVVFANSNKSTTAAETAGLNKSGTKFYFNPSTGLLTATQVANAIWNDYAEYRKQLYTIQPGYVIKDTDSGYIVKANERLIPGAQIVSDTWGHSMGKTDECQTPVAVAGRVLAYTYRSREQYHAGMAVCSAPGGTIDIMTREEIRDYPDAIIGIVSEIPDYEEWGSGKVKVDGRIWIKVR